MGSDKLFHKKKMQAEKELARSKAKRMPYETIAIVCEDSKSSPGYFNKIIKHLRLNSANVIVKSSVGSAPISVVDHAIMIGESSSPIDRVACVIDHDNHESYKRAIDKLKNQKSKRGCIYQAFVSTPCFEIWLLLHFGYKTKSYVASGNKSAAENVMSDLIKKLPSYSKNHVRWFDDLINNLDIAIGNAKQLRKYNDKTGSTNPGTDLHELLEILINLKNKVPNIL